MEYAPIVLFVYNRLEHTKETVEALKKNYGAGDSELHIYSDGAKDNSVDAVKAVRDYISGIDGFKKVHIVTREENMGLAASVIAGVTEVINQHGRVIVMEDDLVVTKYFLHYMNEALQRYRNCPKVFAVTGYSYFAKGNKKLPGTYFAKMAESWTWATWKERWDYFDPAAEGWRELLEDSVMRREFDYDDSFGFSRMLYQQMEEKTIDSWAVRWAYSIYKQQGLTLYPNKSLCINTGFDGTGVHCGTDKQKKKYELHEGTVQYWPDEISEQSVTRKQICREIARQKRAYIFSRMKYYLVHPIRLFARLGRC